MQEACVYRYTFDPGVSLDDIEASLVLSIVSVESLYGESQVRLDIHHLFDVAQRCCVIDAGSDVGRDVNRLFVGYLRHEFGADTFKVEKIERHEATATAGPTR